MSPLSSLHDPHSAFILECYWPGASVEEFRRSAANLADRIEAIAGAGGSIRLLHSTFVPVDESAYCVIWATSRELVEEACAQAGLRCQRLLDAVDLSRLGSDPYG